jgi:hypothetical protein
LATVFISAENPHHKLLPLRQNNALMYELLEELRRIVPDKNIRLAQWFSRANGYRNGYQEKLYRISGINIKDAVRLAHEYEQDNIYIEGKGALNVNSMTLNPIVREHIGEAAYRRPTFILIEGMKALSAEIDFDRSRSL